MARAVSRDEFYAALYADPRDIMPTTEESRRTLWRVVRTREIWGVSSPGTRKDGGEEIYELA